jgi:Bacterial Ig-like domain
MSAKYKLAHLANVALLVLVALLMVGPVACDNELVALEKDNPVEGLRVTMTVPHNGQFAVVLSSKIVIHFNEPIDVNSIGGLVSVMDDAGNPENIEIKVYNSSIIINPKDHWKQRTRYSIMVLPGIRSHLGREMSDSRTFSFETGMRLPKSAEILEVRRVVPGPSEPCWDFQTFRVFFNEPVARWNLKLGDSILFEDVQSGESIPGNIFARSNQLVFDPDNDLVAGRTYRMTLTDKITDFHGDGLAEPYTVSFTPKSTGERTILAMDKCPTANVGESFCDALPEDDLYPKSKFIDFGKNSVFTSSVFLGDTNLMLGGRLWNEFGDSRLSPERIPFVVRKGQKLRGNALEYKVGGLIPSGIQTGKVSLTLLTDAVGEMIGSEYVHGVPGLPATIRLTMDTAMSFETPTANALLPQPTIGAVMVGQASVQKVEGQNDYEAMVIEVLGFSEINLGNEQIPVTVSLQMIPPPSVPERQYDTTPPEILSVAPVDIVVEPEDITGLVDTRTAESKIILYFSEPVDPDSIEGNFLLNGPEGLVKGRYDLWNPKAYFIPDEPLLPDAQYEITAKAGITDLNGNPMSETRYFHFTTMPYQSSAVEPPAVMASAPGRFEGNTLAKNFLPEFFFSQIIDKDSLVYGESYGLYDITYDKTLVGGTVLHYPMFMDFIPDYELTEGHLYLWTINEAVTNLDGVALDTDNDALPGGPPIEIPFTATAYSNFSQTVSMTYPYADTNINGFFENNEHETAVNYMIMDSSMIADPTWIMGYFPINVHEILRGEDGEPRLPINVEPSSALFGTSLRVHLLGKDSKKDPGLLDMGRLRIELQAGSSSDIVTGTDGLLASDVYSLMKMNAANSLIDSLLVHDLTMKILATVRYTKDGRMLTIIEGESMAGMAIPILGVLDIPVYVNMLTCTVPTIRWF